MLKDERLERIQQYLREHRYASLNELAQLFGISKATIRRDVEQLCASGCLQSTRGGVKYSEGPVESELPYHEKEKANREEKIRIAQAACKLIHPGSTILLDTGTTTRAMTTFLMTASNLHIVTNDVLIAADLAVNQNIELTVVGGRMRKGYYTLRGYYAENFLRQLHVDQAFVSMDAVSQAGGCMLTNMDEIAMKQNIIRCASERILLCDHTKYETQTFLRVCDLQEINLFLTGKELDDEIYRRFLENSCEIQRV